MAHCTHLDHVLVTQHPIVRSIEPGEDWSWCFVEEVAMRIGGGPRADADPTVAEARLRRRLRWSGRSVA